MEMQVFFSPLGFLWDSLKTHQVEFQHKFKGIRDTLT